MMKTWLLKNFWRLYLAIFQFGVFISYLRQKPDKEFAEWLDEELTKRGFDVFRDTRLRGGIWRDQIKKQIEIRPGSIVVESPEAQKSKEVGSEVHWMIHNRRMIVPALFRGDDVRPVLSDYQYIDFRNVPFNDSQHKPAGENELSQLDRCLRGEPVESYLSQSIKKISIKFVGFTLICCIFFLLPVKSLVTLFYNHQTTNRLHERQGIIEALEARIPELKVIKPADQIRGVWLYYDLHTHRILVKDHRMDGRLVKREFFEEDVIIGFDVFEYKDDVIIGKVRKYLNQNGQIFMAEKYAQDGLKIGIEYYPAGPEQTGKGLEVEVTRSPLPAAALVFYR